MRRVLRRSLCGIRNGICGSSSGPETEAEPEPWPQLAATNTRLASEMARLQARADYLDATDEMRYYSERPKTPISLSVFRRFATRGMQRSALLEGALFLNAELPVRVAISAHLPDRLPRGFAGLEPFQQVREMFTNTFQELRAFRFTQPAPSLEDEQRFYSLLFTIQHRHKRVPEIIFQGCEQIRAQLKRTYGTAWQVHPDRELTQSVLEDFFRARVGVRFLIGQQVRLHSQFAEGQPPVDVFGLVNLKILPHDIMAACISAVRRMALASFGACPVILLHCPYNEPFVQVPYHIQFVTIRLLRHAVTRLLKTHGLSAVQAQTTPPLQVTVSDGPDNEEVCIHIRDEGGGVPRSNVPYLWSYLHDDSRFGEQDWILMTEDDKQYGESFGLPLARIRARLFGGDVVVQTMEGLGLNMYAYIRKFKESEILPSSLNPHGPTAPV
jgi:pyruvate dehydrogenase kinase 2/3/4